MTVYITAWIAMGLYFAALLASPQSSWRRLLWTLGWLVFLAHVAAAFHFVHHWSHAAATEATNRQTLELIGRPAPYGIYFNYAFLLVWTADVTWQWFAPQIHVRRPPPITWLIHGFMLFVIINAVIVFGQGATRWLGAAALAILAVVTVVRRRRWSAA
jgi:hypothetical protein